MKKCLVTFVTFLICICLIGCSNISLSQNSSKEEDNIVDFPEEKTYNIENILFTNTELQTSFHCLVQNNDIDYDYINESYDTAKIDSMIKHQQKYTDIWLDELAFSCESFSNYLNDEDKLKFTHIQETWENNLNAENQFVGKILVNSETYQVYMGSVFSFECAVEYLEKIRERTLYIKYLQYCMETNGTYTQSISTVYFDYHSQIKKTEKTGDGSLS